MRLGKEKVVGLLFGICQWFLLSDARGRDHRNSPVTNPIPGPDSDSKIPITYGNTAPTPGLGNFTGIFHRVTSRRDRRRILGDWNIFLWFITGPSIIGTMCVSFVGQRYVHRYVDTYILPMYVPAKRQITSLGQESKQILHKVPAKKSSSFYARFEDMLKGSFIRR